MEQSTCQTARLAESGSVSRPVIRIRHVYNGISSSVDSVGKPPTSKAAMIDPSILNADCVLLLKFVPHES